jgi:P4 family phage/plasmid primase-like protien
MTDVIAPDQSEDFMALAFTSAHAAELRSVPDWGGWLRWDGARWKQDNTLMAFDLARKIVRQHAVEMNEMNRAVRLASARTVAAVEKLARADQNLACSPDIWDRHPTLLNHPNGIVDLRTGELRPHDRSLHITKITAVAPRGACPLWLEFLARITEGQEGLAAFLQRIAGYSLTGVTREHAMFFGYGTGGNGKGVFLNTLRAVWGDYADVAPAETFLVTHSERHTTDIAGLRGARLVIAQEIEEGQQWAEAKIKRLTGGDPVKARFMHQNFFEYVPEFKLFVAGNHKPSLRTIDPAIRRRLNLIPFIVNIPEAEQDKELFDKLKAEWPGILQWAVEGCLEWQRIGLAAPPCVSDATQRYLEGEDSVQAWLDDCCTIGPNLTAAKADVRNSWTKWCEHTRTPPGGRNELTDKIEQKGFVSDKGTAGKRCFRGFAIRLEDQSERYWNR